MAGLLGGVLPAVYSYGNTMQRKLKGLLADPLGTVGLGVTRAGEDQQQLVNLAKDAGYMPGSRSVLATPQQKALAQALLAKQATDMGAGMMQAATVWHGSPHKFDRFDSSKIGTGEGAQAYGHGLYFAESPAVAAEYRDKLSKSVTVDGKKLTSIPSDGPMGEAHNMVVRAIQDGMTPEQAIAHTKKYWLNAADEMAAFKKSNPELAARIDSEVASRQAVAAATDSLRPESFFKDPGSLYKVDLPDPLISRMLDWDKPLSQQAPEVQKALGKAAQIAKDEYGFTAKLGNLMGTGGTPEDALSNLLSHNASGSTVYQGMKWHPGVGDAVKGAGVRGSGNLDGTNVLRQAGIPGIRYLDGGSRGAGAGTSNYVVFPGEESALTILERNGSPVNALVQALRGPR